MAKWRTLVGAVALLFFTTAGLAQGGYPKLSGIWKGTYSYREGAGLKEVQFEVQLAQRGQSLSGRIIEPNTFRRSSVPALYANFVGIVDGRRLRFIKTYDGTGGESHSVYYEGDLNESATAVSGVWVIDGGWRGGFKVMRSTDLGGK